MTESRAVPQPCTQPAVGSHDKAMLKYYTTGQLALLDVEGQDGEEDRHAENDSRLNASLDGQYFDVTLMTEPFSYSSP